jgi:hypothetical protein
MRLNFGKLSMRKIALLTPALLAACATAPAAPPVHGETPGHTCQEAGNDVFMGQSGTSETGAAILRSSHAAVLRWAPPGAMMTMDYSLSRVTVRLDAANTITAINCG